MAKSSPKNQAQSDAAKARWARRKEESRQQMETNEPQPVRIEGHRPASIAEAMQERQFAQTAHLQPRSDAEAVYLVEREEQSRPAFVEKKVELDPEITAARMRARSHPDAPQPAPRRPDPVSDPEREAIMRAEEIRRANFRAMMEADERERGPQGRNPRVPMQAVRQTFRRRSWADPPLKKDGTSPVPKGHIPVWVTTESTTGQEPKPSMATVNGYQDYGYDYVRDDDNEPIVTSLGVLMSGSPKAWAERQADLEPTGAFSRHDLDDNLRARRTTTGRYGGRAIATITEAPEHGRGYEREEIPDIEDH